MGFKTAAQKKEEVEALRNSAESIKVRIADHNRWLSYQKPLAECTNGRPVGTQTLSWFEYERERFSTSEVLVKHYTEQTAEMRVLIEAVKAEVARLELRLGV